MAVLPSAPIDQFDPYNDPITGDWLVIFDTRTGKTKKIDAKYFIPAPPSTNYKWVSTFDYPVDGVVELNGKWYKSLLNPNVGHIPTEPASIYWEETNKSQSGFVYWTAGVFTQADVIVLKKTAGITDIYELIDPTRPFISTDFDAELSAGKWRNMTGAGAALTDGQGTTADGTAIDIGGNVVTEREIFFINNTHLNFLDINANLALSVGMAGGATEAIITARNSDSSQYIDIQMVGAGAGGIPEATIRDSRAVPRGIEYGADYSGFYTARSLVDREFVITAIGTLIQHYRGYYTSSGDLVAAIPSANPGDYATVDPGTGNDAQIWIWDNDDVAWKQGGSAPTPAWSTAIAGLVELSTTAEAQNIVTRALAGSSDSSNSDARAPSEKGLVEMLISFLAGSITNEIPSGLVNSSNTIFNLANTPIAGTLRLFAGIRLKESVDFTISGTTITMSVPPDTGQNLIADYRK